MRTFYVIERGLLLSLCRWFKGNRKAIDFTAKESETAAAYPCIKLRGIEGAAA